MYLNLFIFLQLIHFKDTMSKSLSPQLKRISNIENIFNKDDVKCVSSCIIFPVYSIMAWKGNHWHVDFIDAGQWSWSSWRLIFFLSEVMYFSAISCKHNRIDDHKHWPASIKSTCHWFPFHDIMEHTRNIMQDATHLMSSLLKMFLMFKIRLSYGDKYLDTLCLKCINCTK